MVNKTLSVPNKRRQASSKQYTSLAEKGFLESIGLIDPTQRNASSLLNMKNKSAKRRKNHIVTGS